MQRWNEAILEEMKDHLNQERLSDFTKMKRNKMSKIVS